MNVHLIEFAEKVVDVHGYNISTDLSKIQKDIVFEIFSGTYTDREVMYAWSKCELLKDKSNWIDTIRELRNRMIDIFFEELKKYEEVKTFGELLSFAKTVSYKQDNAEVTSVEARAAAIIESAIISQTKKASGVVPIGISEEQADATVRALKKQTSKQVDEVYSVVMEDMYNKYMWCTNCPSCSSCVPRRHLYCWNCGQKINWAEK